MMSRSTGRRGDQVAEIDRNALRATAGMTGGVVS